MTADHQPQAEKRFAEFDLNFRKEFYRLLEARRSIRRFKSDPVPAEVLQRLLNAAMQAPSGKNRQNWRFFVLQSEARDQFTERFFFTLGDAPVVILCYSMNDKEERYHTSIGSVYMAVENLNLACVAEGLGCCTMGAPLEIREDVDKFLKLDQRPEYRASEMELLCGIVLGWPDHDPPKAPRQIDGRVEWITSIED
jgi:nitroreductase